MDRVDHLPRAAEVVHTANHDRVRQREGLARVDLLRAISQHVRATGRPQQREHRLGPRRVEVLVLGEHHQVPAWLLPGVTIAHVLGLLALYGITVKVQQPEDGAA
jgi:hypothetical protein